MGWQTVTAVALALMVSGATCQTRGSSCTTSQGLTGTCGPIRDCPALSSLLQAIKQGTAPSGSLNILRKKWDNSFRIVLNSIFGSEDGIEDDSETVVPPSAIDLVCAFAICSFLNSEPLVCCPSQSLPVTAVNTPPTRPPPVVQTPPPSRANVQCGSRGIADKIIDGEDAPLGAWPWMVVLRGSINGRRSWFCGGVLVSERYVLTAAHCFKERLGLVLEIARIGEHTLSINPDCSKGRCAPPPQDIPVERIIRHPQYGSPCTECNDIALLRLSRPAVLHPRFVAPVCLPTNPVQDMGFSEQEFQGKAAWAAGWGSTARDFSVSRRPDVLQQVQLPIQELNYCDRLRRGYPDSRMTLCAGGEGRDTCRGDSGGPLTLDNQFGTRSFIVGVTSLGPRSCGSTNTQGLYTNVAFYLPWILRNMQE